MVCTTRLIDFVVLWFADLLEGSSHARKAARRQKREQRERQRHERYQQQQHEFRLERKRPLSGHGYPPSDAHLPPPSVLSSHSPYHNDPRLPGNANPQLTKWILEQNVHYQTDRGSEIDLQSSRSSLTNIPERDRPGSPGNSYSGNRYLREAANERGGSYRPTSPPVRDLAPSRPSDYSYSSRYDGYSSSTALDIPSMSEAPTKFSEYTIPEMDRPRPRPAPPPSSGNAAGYKNTFSSLSSQMTLESQQMLTPYSQQQTPSQQQQQQHLDKLSMDVMLHTQLSGTSIQGGITSLIPKFNPTKNVKTSQGKSHLDRADLKELEMDEIDLEKQRIQLMFYEQQKQVKENEEQEEAASCHKTEPLEVLEGAEKEEQCLSTEHLKQELESLDQIVSDQKKKYREIKMAREREEQNLKQAERDLFTECVNPNDQHHWQAEQKRRLREFEKLKSEQNERLQQIQYNEHRARHKLKAFEAQAAEIRQQLQAAQSVSQQLNVRRSPSQTKQSTGGFNGGHDVYPSKLTSDNSQRGDGQTTEQSVPSNVIEWEWGGLDGSKPGSSIPARVMSVESMSTAITFDPPDIARELATTVSASVLTEPTQDDSSPSKWLPSGYGSRSVSGGLMQSDDFFSTKSHSRNTLMTDPDDIFLNQDDRLHREHPQSMDTLDAMESFLPSPSLRTMDERDVVCGQQGPRGYPQETQLAFRRTRRIPSNGAQNQVMHSHEQAWGNKQQQPGTEREMGKGGDQAAAHYDVPAHARAAYQHHHPSSSNRQRGWHHKNRGSSSSSSARNQPSGMAVDLPSLDRPVQDAPRLVNGTSGGAPDVVPTSYSPASPHLVMSPVPVGLQQQRQVTGGVSMMATAVGLQQRQVTGGVSMMATAVPPQSPSYPVYDVPPSRAERGRLLGANYNPQPLTSSSPVSIPTSSHQEPANFAQQQQMNVSSHPVSTPQPGGVPPASPTANNIYDQPRSIVPRSSHSPRVTGTSSPLYDIPASARRSAGHEGGVAVLRQDLQAPNLAHPQAVDHNVSARESERAVSNAMPTTSKSKTSSSHRYGISKSGMGHSYSRGRPDHVQQIALDKAKQYMDSRSYRNQGGVRHPERIQRQQTDL